MRAPRYLVFFLLCIAPLAGAQVFPEIPSSSRVLGLLEVKNFWMNKLPQPHEPSLLRRNQPQLVVDYHRQVGERHRLIQAIRSGRYDKQARIVMLRHNIGAYRMLGEDGRIPALMEELAELEAEMDQQRVEEESANRLERLIAATERLAAAIEANGGEVPDDADEIVPFERDADDSREVIVYLEEEIARCRQPIIVHDPHYRHTHHHEDRGHSHNRRQVSRPNVVTIPVQRPHTTNNPIRVRQPQVRQPDVRPIRVSPKPRISPQPQVRQPRVPSVRSQPKPQVQRQQPQRRSVFPSQPRVPQAR